MVTINSKLIDKYNFELSPISYLHEINSEYVVLINTNTDGTAGTNKKVKIGLLKDYMNLSYTGTDSIENKVNESIKLMREQIGTLQTQLNSVENKNTELTARVEALETVISLT